MTHSTSALYNRIDFAPSLFFDPCDLPPLPGLTPKHVSFLALCAARFFAEANTLEIKHDESGYSLDTNVYGIVITSTLRDSVLSKASCPKFWRRAIENKENDARLNLEAANKTIGGKDEDRIMYCSDESLHRVSAKRKSAIENLKKLKVRHLESGRETDMSKIALKNEKNRVNELYKATINIQKIADIIGCKWLFITLTSPPEFHPNPSKGKCSYRPEIGVKASHCHINEEWKKIRARLAKKELHACPQGYFGVRTVEPHKDGCLHWHLLIFTKSKNILSIKKEILKSFPRKNQCKIVIQKPGRDAASAATYLYKYISKSFSTEESKPNADEEIADLEREKNDLASHRNKERVQAALKCLRVRQYQPFGMKRVTTLNRLINKLDLSQLEPPKGTPLEFIKNEVWRNPEGIMNLLKIHIFPDKGDTSKNQDQVYLIKENTQNSYGEPAQRVIGIQIGELSFLNKTLYRIERS